MREGLAALARKFCSIREVRGLGLMIGVEIQSDSGEPAPALRDWMIDLAFQRGLLLLPCGTSTIRICPPLCLTIRQVEIGLDLFGATLSAAEDEIRKVKATLVDRSFDLEQVGQDPT
jgi:4-aminobutyrate aminotransferase